MGDKLLLSVAPGNNLMQDCAAFMRHHRFGTAILLTIAFAFAAISMPAPAENHSPNFTEIDDDGIVEKLEQEGTRLIREGKTAPLAQLREQLKRKSCNVECAKPIERKRTPAELYATRRDGVLVVAMIHQCSECTRWHASASSGFSLASGGILVTNRHVVDDPTEGNEALVVMNARGDVFPVAEVLASDAVADVAVLRADGLVATPLPLVTEPTPVGAPIWLISHPDHNFYSLSEGIVSRQFIARLPEGKTPHIAITADFGMGSSGGPVLDENGNVVAIVESTTSLYSEAEDKNDTSDLQMVFKHCIPARSIRSLLQGSAGLDSMSTTKVSEPKTKSRPRATAGGASR